MEDQRASAEGRGETEYTTTTALVENGRWRYGELEVALRGANQCAWGHLWSSVSTLSHVGVGGRNYVARLRACRTGARDA
ncbi:MAG: hypothetical protein ACPL3C_09595 [Pyrobaculum sp.]